MQRPLQAISPLESHLAYWLHYVGNRLFHALRCRAMEFGVSVETVKCSARAGKLTSRGSSGHRLPQFDGISIRIVQPGETTLGIFLWIYLDRDVRGVQLFDHGVEIPDAKVDHPGLLQ
jgi:hypothetical protein